MRFFKTCSFAFRCFILSVSFLATVFAIYLCIELPVHIRYQREISTVTKRIRSVKQWNQDEIELTLDTVQYLQETAQKCEKTDYHKANYIRSFAIPCRIRKIAVIRQNTGLALPEPESLGAWLSVIDESEYDDSYDLESDKSKKQMIDEIQGNGFLLEVFTTIWASDQGECLGIPEKIEIEIEGLPTFQTTLPLGECSNLKGDKMSEWFLAANKEPELLKNNWGFVGLTCRIWIQFADKPIPEYLRDGIQDGRIGLLRLPKEFPRSLRDLSERESIIRIQSSSENTRLPIQYDIYSLNHTEDKHENK